jgi:transposase
MLTLGEGTPVYLACGSTDLRKSIDGLAAIVSPQSDLGTPVFELDLFSSSLFVFCNRGRDKLKILVWDTNGFWLYYRRLERGRFRWPAQPAQKTVTVSRRQLQWLLDGLTLEQQQAHAPVTARLAV